MRRPVTIPSRPPPRIHQLLRNNFNLGWWSSSGSDRGITHFFTAQEIQSKEWEKKNNSSARRASLWHCIPCRITLACISSEISTNHEECWLILTGLPSLLLDSISCRLVSLLSGVDCQLPLSIARRQLPSLSSFDQLLFLAFPYPLPITSKIAGSGFCLVSRRNRQRDRLLSGPPT